MARLSVRSERIPSCTATTRARVELWRIGSVTVTAPVSDRGPRGSISTVTRGEAQCETAAAAISETSSRLQNRSSANGAISSGTDPVWIRSAIVTPTIGVALNP